MAASDVTRFNPTFFLFLFLVGLVELGSFGTGTGPALVLAGASAVEKHMITFDNRCGHGTPQLIQQGKVLSKGEPFTSNGPFISGIAYLQTGGCLLNGEGCTLVEMTLINPTCPGCGSSSDISLIPPHAYSVPVSFSYYGGCSGQGATCSSPTCNAAFFVPDDNQVQVECQDENVNLLITFCAGGSASGASAPSSVHGGTSNSGVPAAHATTTGASALSSIVMKTIPSATSIVDGMSLTKPSAIPPNAPQCASTRRKNRRRSLSDSASSSPLSTKDKARRLSRVHLHMRSRQF